MTTQSRIYSNMLGQYQKVSSSYGERIHPKTKVSKFHGGMDLSVPVGTEVRAPAAGELWAAEEGTGYGNVMVLAHPSVAAPTSFTVYAHLKELPSTPVGTKIAAGQQFAVSGNTGVSTGAHLHYEERLPAENYIFEVGTSRENYIKIFEKSSTIDPDLNLLGFGTWNPSLQGRADLTKSERIGQLLLTDAQFDAYKVVLPSIETNGKSLEQSYLTTSATGKFLGRYQLGDLALITAGYQNVDGSWTSYAQSKGVTDTQSFLSNPLAQDDALRRLTNANAAAIVQGGFDLRIGESVGGVQITAAGLFMGEHSKPSSVAEYMRTEGAVDPVDGNKVPISRYLKLGKSVPMDDAPGSPIAGTGSASQGGYWQEEVFYSDLGIPVMTRSVWVPGPGKELAPKSAEPPVNHWTKGALYLSRDGASVTFPDGKQVGAGAGGRIDLQPDGGALITRVAPGYDRAEMAVFDVVRFDGMGRTVSRHEIQMVPDPERPGEKSALVALIQGQTKTFTLANADGTTSEVKAAFQVGLGWVEPGTGELILDLKTWARAPQAGTPALPLEGYSATREVEAEAVQIIPEAVGPSLPQHAESDESSGYGEGRDDGGADGDLEIDGHGQDAQENGNESNLDAKTGSSVPSLKDQLDAGASAVSLMNSIIGLQHWNSMTDLQRTAAVASIYNAADAMTGSNSLPGNLGAASSMLGLLSALDKGNVGSALLSGISLVDQLADKAASELIGSALGVEAGSVIPGLGLALAIESGDPAAMLAAALVFIPVYGQILSIIVTVLSSIFGEHDLPMHEGLAHAYWDSTGDIQIQTDIDTEGGGPTAEGWMRALVDGLQSELGRNVDSLGTPNFALIPDLLPSIGYKYDPDGINLASAKGHLYLKWIDEEGQTQTRYYDGNGNRADGTGDSMAADFMQHALTAIAPSWAVQTTLAHLQQGLGLHLPSEKADLPESMADGLHQTLQTISLTHTVSSQANRTTFADIDHDGFLEASEWVGSTEAVLAIDINLDGVIDTTELLTLRDTAAFNNLRWLDANGDQLLDASDPAFARLRLWIDSNGDAISNGETIAATDAGIVGIDFGATPPQAIYADGTREDLTLRTLTADLLGAIYNITDGGLLETSEQPGGKVTQVLAAVNTREFDEQPEHSHRDDLKLAQVEVDDSRLKTGSVGRALSGQGAQEDEIVLSISSAAQLKSRDTVRSAGRASGFEPVRHVSGVGRPGMSTASWIAMSVAAGATAGAAEAAVQQSIFKTRQDLDDADPSNASIDQPAQLENVHPEMASALVPVKAQTHQSFDSLERTPLQAAHVGRAASTQHAQNFYGVGDSAQEHRGEFKLQPYGSKSWGLPNTVSDHADQVVHLNEHHHLTAAPVLLDSAVPRVNSAPHAIGESIESREDQRIEIDAAALLANDFDDDMPHDPLRIVAVGNAKHGTVSMDEMGRIHFNPDRDFFGTASFTYDVDDQLGGVRSATTTIEIAPVNDAPVAIGEEMTIAEDTEVRFTSASLLRNDSDVDNAWIELSISSVGNAVNGTVRIVNGEVVFTPARDYFGAASFTYTVSDGVGGLSEATVNFDITAVNDAPIATDDGFIGLEDVAFSIAAEQLLINDRDVDNPHADLKVSAVAAASHGTVSMDAGGNVWFMPDTNYFGTASFEYEVSDVDGAATWATAFLNVQPVNDAPIIEDIWLGLPIYGFKRVSSSGDRLDDSFYTVGDLGEAQALLSVGALLAGPYSSAVQPSYYMNGELRPIAFDRRDASVNLGSMDDPHVAVIDDPYRGSGHIVAYDPDGNSGDIVVSVGANPQHGHAWVNQSLTPYIVNLAPGPLDTSIAQTMTVPDRNSWVYISHLGDEYTGADQFTISVTDAEGASTSVVVNAQHEGSSPSGRGRYIEMLSPDPFSSAEMNRTATLFSQVAGSIGEQGPSLAFIDAVNTAVPEVDAQHLHALSSMSPDSLAHMVGAV